MSVGVSRVFHSVLNVLLPQRCLRCGALVENDGGLCGACWPEFRFLAPPRCGRCGIPFADDLGDDVLCGACLLMPPSFDQARAVMAYDDGSRPVVLAFKHGDRTDMAGTLAALMVGVAGDMLDEADLLTPVPLHWSRLFSRRFNQAALLAVEIAKQTGLVYLPRSLVRIRRTASQGRQSRRARVENLRGAIRVRADDRPRIVGRRIVLVDDVMTSGATANACASALKRAGAATVDVLTLSRVVRTEN